MFDRAVKKDTFPRDAPDPTPRRDKFVGMRVGCILLVRQILLFGRKRQRMKLSESITAFLNEKRFGVLATVNADGSPQQTVMWYLPIDDDTILMNTKKGRIKDKNLGRDNRVSLCVEDGQRYVAMRGTITVDDDPDHGQETMKAVTTRYEGADVAERQMNEMYSKQHRITLTLKIDSVDTHGFEG
jgi:PPOX class probable F420-dependent enzyme